MLLAAAVDQVPVVGEPIAYGTGALVAVVVGLSRFVGRYPLTLVHEGGHMLAAIVFLRRVDGFELADNGNGVTSFEDRRWAPSTLVIYFAGYSMPCLLGWGGAALIANGSTWGVLILGLLYSLLAIIPANNWLARLVPALLVVGIGWTLLDGTPYVQAAVAVGMVWYLLIGGLLDGFELSRGEGSDPHVLARKTVVVPAIVWQGTWITLGVVCLWQGGTLLLRVDLSRTPAVPNV